MAVNFESVKNKKFFHLCNLGMMILGFLLIFGGVLFMFGRSQTDIVYFNRYSELRLYTGIFLVFDGIVLLILRSIFFNPLKSKKWVLAISALLLIVAFANSARDYVKNQAFVSARQYLEYRYIGYWSFYDMKTKKLDSRFSLGDLTKNFQNSLGSDGAHRPRWLGMIVNSIQPKFNAWAYYKFGITSVNAFSFTIALLVAFSILFFMWKVTHDPIVSASAFILYFSSFEFMSTSIIFHRIAKPPLTIPFLFLILLLGMVKLPISLKPIGIMKSAAIFLLVMMLIGLDEFGLCMLAALLIAYRFQYKLVTEEQRRFLKSNFSLFAKIAAINIFILVLIFAISRPSFVPDNILFTCVPRLEMVNIALNAMIILPHTIGYFSDLFFHNLGFHNSSYIMPMKGLMQVIYIMIFFLIWICYKYRERRTVLYRFFSVHMLGSCMVVLLSLLTLGNITNNLTYYSSPISAGYPIYMALIAYTLKDHKNKALYTLTIFIIGIIAIVNSVINSFAFDKTERYFWQDSDCVYDTQLSRELRDIRASIGRGERPVLEHDPATIGQKLWAKYPYIKAAYGKEIKTLPLLYYYLLPYIQQGKVWIRKEYKEDILF